MPGGLWYKSIGIVSQQKFEAEKVKRALPKEGFFSLWKRLPGLLQKIDELRDIIDAYQKIHRLIASANK